MAYVLKQMSSADKQKILLDAKVDRGKELSLLADPDFLNGQSNWAINEEKDAYLIAAPILVRPDSQALSHYIHFRGKLYEVKVLSLFRDDVAITGDVEPSLLPDLQAEIGEAFSVFGRFGNGPLDEAGRPEYRITPKFKGE